MFSQPSMQPAPAIQRATANARPSRRILIEESSLIRVKSKPKEGKGQREKSNLCAAFVTSVSLWWMFGAANSPQRHKEHRGSTEKI